MEISDASRQTGISSVAPASETASPAIASDFETFLRMLTAQIENQDPLNPVDSTEFATQLATFSSVEQQVLTNDLLTVLGAQMSAMGSSQLFSWVGMNAYAAMPVNYYGDPVPIVTEGSAIADKAYFVVRDETGKEVDRFEISTDRAETEWDGKTKDGQQLPIGTYSVEVESQLDGEVIDTKAALVEARIVEARSENGEAIFVMSTGQEVFSYEIVALREPTQSSSP